MPIDDSIMVAIPVHQCKQCQAPVVKRAWWNVVDWRGNERGIDSQLKAAGIRPAGKHYWTDHLCEECEAKGREAFTCALCNEVRRSDEVQESVGDPAEYLCQICYATVPAKQWDAKQGELYDAHRYDFE